MRLRDGDPRPEPAAQPSTDSAVRVDSQLGIRETVEFFGSGPQRLFGCLHLPLRAAVGGVVICSPILADFSANYRREVLVARALAARGFAVQRFHYRGSGNSDGDPAAMTFDSLREDALLAADRVREAAGLDSVSFLGTRWSALVAASAASVFPGAPLVLWEPTVEPARFFREAFRARMVREVTQRQEGPASVDQLLEDFEAVGWIDVIGYPVFRLLYESCEGRTLLGELGDEPRSLQLVQFGTSHRLPGEYQRLVSALAERGFRPAVATAAVGEPWWPQSERILPIGDLVEQTVAWMEGELVPEVIS